MRSGVAVVLIAVFNYRAVLMDPCSANRPFSGNICAHDHPSLALSVVVDITHCLLSSYVRLGINLFRLSHDTLPTDQCVNSHKSNSGDRLKEDTRGVDRMFIFTSTAYVAPVRCTGIR